MALSDAKPYAVAHWSLDEASGTRADSVGSNDLTDNNTVGSATGMFGNAADFEASSSEYLSCADDAALSLGSDEIFMVRCWVQLESKTTARVILGKDGGGGGDREYILYYDSGTDRFTWIVWGGTGSAGVVEANSLGSPSTGTWYLIHAWHDPVANYVRIAVNAGTTNETSHSDGTRNLAATFQIGAGIGDGGFPFDGLIDDVVLLKGYILDATERAEDYNSGAGVAFEDWDAGDEFTAAVTLSTEAATLSASGTHTPPAFTATSALSAEVTTTSASGTHTPPAFTATSTLATEITTTATSGTHTPPSFSATSTLTTEVATTSVSGIYTPPAFSATSAIATEVTTATASGTHTPPAFTATSTLTTEAAAASVSGTHTPPSFTATVTLSVEVAALSSSGTVVNVYTASAALAVSVAIVSGSGNITADNVTGVSSLATDVITISAAGTFSTTYSDHYYVVARQLTTDRVDAFQVTADHVDTAQIVGG